MSFICEKDIGPKTLNCLVLMCFPIADTFVPVDLRYLLFHICLFVFLPMICMPFECFLKCAKVTVDAVKRELCFKTLIPDWICSWVHELLTIVF